MNHSCHWDFTAFHCFPFQRFIKTFPAGSVFKLCVDNIRCMNLSRNPWVTKHYCYQICRTVTLLRPELMLQPPLLTYSSIKSQIWLMNDLCQHKFTGRKLYLTKNLKLISILWVWGIWVVFFCLFGVFVMLLRNFWFCMSGRVCPSTAVMETVMEVNEVRNPNTIVGAWTNMCFLFIYPSQRYFCFLGNRKVV